MSVDTRLRGALVRIAAACAGLCAACSALGHIDDPPTARVRGPITARPEHPLAATWLSLRPRRATTLTRGHGELSLEASYASFFENSPRVDRSVIVDGEVLTLTERARFGVGDADDVEIALPVTIAGPGFLDEFVERWHEFFGLPDGRRDTRPRDEYLMRIENGGNEAFRLQGGEWSLGDMDVVWTHNLRREDDRGGAWSARLGVELPTGSVGDGTGNGEIDFGGGWLYERSRGRFTFSAAADLVVTADGRKLRNANLEADDLFDLQAGVEYRWNDATSLLAGLVAISPMVTDLDLDSIDQPILDLGLGIAWDSGGSSTWRASFHEDLISDAGPDFGVLLSWTRAW